MDAGFAFIGFAVLVLVWKAEDLIKLWRDCERKPNQTYQNRNHENKSERTKE